MKGNNTIVNRDSMQADLSPEEAAHDEAAAANSDPQYYMVYQGRRSDESKATQSAGDSDLTLSRRRCRAQRPARVVRMRGWQAVAATVLLLLAPLPPAASFEPLSFTASAVGAGAAGWAISLVWNSMKDAPIVRHVARSSAVRFVDCKVRECCDDPYLIRDLSELRRALAQFLHGQHLVASHLPRIIENHRRDGLARKPLVLSLHGTTGVGKNFVAQRVADSLFSKGMKSRFVHLFVGSMDFPHDDPVSVSRYASDLRHWVIGNLSSCEHQLFIFDEVDKMPGGILNGIHSVMDFHGDLRGVDISQAVFVLLSNTGGKAINSLMRRRFAESLPREDVQLDDFNVIITERAFDETGGLYRSDIISSALVDLYLPFLPLERRHVELCIRDELLRRGVVSGAPEAIKHVLRQVWFDSELQTFAKVGCKDIANKVSPSAGPMATLEWQEFAAGCAALLRRSAALGDEWEARGHWAEEGAAYLVHKTTIPAPDSGTAAPASCHVDGAGGLPPALAPSEPSSEATSLTDELRLGELCLGESAPAGREVPDSAGPPPETSTHGSGSGSRLTPVSREECVTDVDESCLPPGGRVWVLEHHVVYSLSYCVPVLFVSGREQSGSPLSPEHLRRLVPDLYSDRMATEAGSTLSQIEHPVLQLPLCGVHPCKTAQMMDSVLTSTGGAAKLECTMGALGEGEKKLERRGFRYIVLWLSLFGPLCGLRLAEQYADFPE